MNNDDWDSVSDKTPPDSATDTWDAVSTPQLPPAPARRRSLPDNLVIEGDAFQPTHSSGQDIPITPPSEEPQPSQDVEMKPLSQPHPVASRTRGFLTAPTRHKPVPASLLKRRIELFPLAAYLLVTRRIELFALAAFLLVISGFGVFQGISTHNANVAATATAATEATVSANANATVTAQAVATTTAAQQIYTQFTSGTPAFTDALTDNSNGWATFNASWGACGFTGGAYHFTLSSGNYWNFCNCPSTQNFNNFALQVHVNIAKGNDGGIVFGMTANSYYRIYIDSRGTYTLYQYTKSNNQTQTLLSSSSFAINTGLNQDNTITVIVNNSNFYFYANNQFVTSAYLSAYRAGAVSLTAESTDQATDVVFSYFEAWTL